MSPALTSSAFIPDHLPGAMRNCSAAMLAPLEEKPLASAEPGAARTRTIPGAARTRANPVPAVAPATVSTKAPCSVKAWRNLFSALLTGGLLAAGFPISVTMATRWLAAKAGTPAKAGVEAEAASTLLREIFITSPFEGRYTQTNLAAAQRLHAAIAH